ncbi:hypothetical protein WJX77_003280 [Trebouxia sp. C0004]
MSRVVGGFSTALPVQPCLTGPVPPLQTVTQSSRRPVLTPLKALHIDRRQHLELAWQRQQGEEELLQQHLTVTVPTVLEVRTLAHLDQLIDSAGSAIVLLYFYSKSCGTCKEVLQHCSQLCQENSHQRAGVLFLKHNIWNDFDDLTDVARMYKAKAVPSFIFLTGGAMVRRLRMPDARNMYGSTSVLNRMYGYEKRRLHATLREMLFRNTPSARR